ncbi:hypothetical protein [Actinomyces ruminicola]|uniref:Oxidoreductase family, NAD-binding Rossmann fold n=1 Tax=Actinomyces ruminicola TaxID=332524 RepID=A0A1G9SXJ8_9ACTO|nr:hypothetical protein [Actinomyces ruminicola]SDM40159.1 hypothetical protein SAMN04487766_102133 [Actinomyces ruminicola]
MSKDRIGVGIIGVGGWATCGHLPALGLVDDFRLAAVSSRSLDKARE